MQQEATEILLSRDTEVVLIPSGDKRTLPEGTRCYITQSLGGSHTIATDNGLARVTAQNADALGLEAAEAGAPTPAVEPGQADEKAVWDKLRTCYDPEIPVNIVDLGLVYDCTLTDTPAGSKVDVKMTLTAPGCGMGPTITAEARDKILTLPGVAEADVELVWDPAWNQDMISEVGKMQLGLI